MHLKITFGELISSTTICPENEISTKIQNKIVQQNRYNEKKIRIFIGNKQSVFSNLSSRK